VAFSEVEREGEYGFTMADQVQEVDQWVVECALAELGVPWVDSWDGLAKTVPDYLAIKAGPIGEQLHEEFQRRKAIFYAMPAPALSEAERRLNEVRIEDPDKMEIPDGYVAAEFSLGGWHPWGIGKPLKWEGD
jgi:hypothetical protein